MTGRKRSGAISKTDLLPISGAINSFLNVDSCLIALFSLYRSVLEVLFGVKGVECGGAKLPL